MKTDPQKKKAGRPSVSDASKATKPNITLANRLQDEARAAAKKKGIGYSDFVADAIHREIAREEVRAEIEKELLESTNQQEGKTKRHA